VKGTIHWVSAAHSIDSEVRLMDRLFSVPEPDAAPAGGNFRSFLNPASLEVLTGCKVEASLSSPSPAYRFQFERLGYFCVDSADGQRPAHPDRVVFNRIIGLRDSWAKDQRKS
jgi:glutaminyl-tRNA synthetase